MEKKCKYKFSVVIPIYNVEEYLEETIESVINQDIGFEENIQMIFVNDGSPDNSEEICLKYKEMYPNNVVYVKQENSGVSAARNNGKQYVEGKYTNFLDSDDKWELDAFSKVWDFFEENYDKINLLSCRMKFFEAKNGFHPLDYKFNRNNIIDILEDYDLIQLHITSSFIKSEVLSKYKFDARLKFAEDSKFISEIILDKKKYGVMSNAIHYYRKRANESSAVQNRKKSKDWFFYTPKYMYKELINKSIDKYSYVLPYVQYVIMYDLQWRLKEECPEILSDKEKKEYVNIIIELLQYIEDYIIYEQKNIYSEYKYYALCLKYGEDISKKFVYKKNKLYFNNLALTNLKSKSLLRIDILELQGNNLIIEGQVNCNLPTEDYNIYIQVKNGEKYPVELYEIHTYDRMGLMGKFIGNKAYKIKLPLDDIKEFKIMIKYKKINTIRLNIDLKKFAKINKDIQESYYTNGRFTIKQRNNIFYVIKNEKNTRINFEKNYLKKLRKLKEFDIIRYRILYFLLKNIKKKPIWIISDRTHVANDNGFRLYQYLCKNEKKAEIYFAIDGKSKDYKKIKKIGKVLKHNSIKYKVYFLLASKIISSQADEWVINAFGNKRELVKDLYKFKFIFLQHGIIQSDLSNWLHKYNKNIKLFVTSNRNEYNSIINNKYLYTKKEVKLLGLPRYDRLKSDSKKKIVFMPTWRKNISKETVNGTSLREYDENFKKTDYFKFYNGLINDERILKCLKENGYKAKFCIHPSFEKQYVDFKSNELVEISKSIVNYQKEFEENALLITDFSSVAFDFAYLNKKVIYTQYDADTFFEGHLSDKGYFDYERDGLGPVCYDYESAVKEIISSIENDCKLDKKYEERINEFYEYHDKDNCKRVHEEILKLK